MKVSFELSEDRQSADLVFQGPPRVAVSMKAEDIEAFIHDLGIIRSQMQPPVPPSFPLGQKVTAIVNPGWLAEPDALQGHSLLHFGHPGFGWVHLLLPPEQATKLSDLLRNQAALPPPGFGQRNPN